MRRGGRGAGGAAPVAPAPPAIDGMTTLPIGAFSTARLLCPTYSGPAFKVRRTNNDELDIGFVGRAVDTAALLTFCAGASAYITTWHDQSGNGRHWTQTVTTKQPRIVNAGVVELLVAGVPAMKFDGVDDLLTRADSFGLTGSPAITQAWSFKEAAGDSYVSVVGLGASANTHWMVSPSYSTNDLYISQHSSHRNFTWPSKTVAASYIAAKAASATPSAFYLERNAVALTQSGLVGGGNALNMSNVPSYLGTFPPLFEYPAAMHLAAFTLFNADLQAAGAERTALRAEHALHA